jgi:uncharacterized protein
VTCEGPREDGRSRRSSSSTTTSRSPSRRSPRTASSRSAAARRRACCAPSSELDPERPVPKLEARDEARSPARRGAASSRPRSPTRYKRCSCPSVESDVRVELKMKADRAPSRSSPQNLRTLLLAAPLGGEDRHRHRPGQRTGCKSWSSTRPGSCSSTRSRSCRATGRSSARKRAIARGLRAKHGPSAIAVGNGTARPRDRGFVREVLAEAGPSTVRRRAGERVGRERVLGERRGARGVPRPRPHGARRDLDRAPPAGPARRAREDRPEVASASGSTSTTSTSRCSPQARRGGRELREPRGRRAQHRERAAARRTWPASGRRSRRSIVAHRDEKGALRESQGAARGDGPRAAHLRAVRGLLAHPRRRAPARRERRAPRALRPRRAHRRDLGVPVAELVGNASSRPRDPGQQVRAARRREPTLRDILAELEEAGPRPARELRAAEVPRRRRDARGPQARAWSSRASSPTSRPSARSSTSACTRTASCTSPALRPLREATPREVVKVGDKLNKVLKVLEVDPRRRRRPHPLAFRRVRVRYPSGMEALGRRRMTYEEYLAFERASETKHEYVNGEVFAMAGGTREHARLVPAVRSGLNSESGSNFWTDVLASRPRRDARVRSAAR